MTAAPALVERDLAELELLRAYKAHFGRHADVNDSPFGGDRVVRYGSNVGGYDVPVIHGQVRAEIESILRGIHAGQPSQVVILAGSPGMGKSHIINQFRGPVRAAELGIVLVGNSNHWKADEFDGQLLDWLIAALVAPAPEEPHPLLTKVQDVAFRALATIVSQPGQLNKFKAKSAANVVARVWAKLRGNDFAAFRAAIDARDPEVFRKLDFDRFAKYVCARFLAEPGNPFHRYLIHVLLRYLFPEDREYVLHWLRGQKVGDVFLTILGVVDAIDRQYKVFDAIKVLISLFTPEVADRLSDGPPMRGAGRVFFFAFDQLEGRNELFDNERDWFKFFAQLSELYNTLPNVFVLFTMTLKLREKLYGRMEGQFRDRIRRDEKFLLQEIDDTEVLALYQQRMRHWLTQAPGGLWDRALDAGKPYLPFTAERVAAMARKATLRSMLDEFDRQFRDALRDIPTEAPFDYMVAQKEFRAEEATTNANDYTEGFLELLSELLVQPDVKQVLHDDYRVQLVDWDKPTTSDNLATRRVKLQDVGDPRWVRVVFARFRTTYVPYLDGCKALIANKRILNNQLWLVRTSGIASAHEQALPVNAKFRTYSPATHTDLRALLAVLNRRDDYKPEEWAKFVGGLGTMLRKSPLGDVLGEVRQSMDNQKLKGDAAEEGEP